MTSHLRLLCLIFVTVLPLRASTMEAERIKDIFKDESGLSSDKIDEGKFQIFNFDIGTTKSATIIKNINGGRTSVGWDNGEKSFVTIKAFAQKRYDKYVQELDTPMDIINRIPSANSKAALRDELLKNSWRVGEMKGIGAYCVGQLHAGLGGNIVSTGFFFNDEYGFCLQISTLEESGIELEAVESIGKKLTEEMVLQAKADGLIANPLTKSGPFAVAQPKVSRGTKKPSITEQDPSVLEDAQKPANSSISGKSWRSWPINLGLAVALLLAIFLLLLKLFRK